MGLSNHKKQFSQDPLTSRQEKLGNKYSGRKITYMQKYKLSATMNDREKLLLNRLNIPAPCTAEQPMHPRMH